MYGLSVSAMFDNLYSYSSKLSSFDLGTRIVGDTFGAFRLPVR